MIYSTIITLRPTRGYGTTTIQEKTDNKVTETSTSPKKYSMTYYFKCRYHLTHSRWVFWRLFTYGRPKSLHGRPFPLLSEPVWSHVWETLLPPPIPLQKICFKYRIRLKFSIVLSYLK